MTPAFGFSVGDFIAAIELCTKVAKALKDSGAAAAEYQQVVLELQGLQNILTRLAAFEPTKSNIQHVNVIRAAALASVLALQGFLSKLEKFEDSMSPFATKKTFTVGRAQRKAQYALVMADEVKKMRAIIYGNVIRINVLLATHASETLSRIEDRLTTHHQDSTVRFQDTRNDMANIIVELAEMKAEETAFRDEVRQDFQRSTSQMKGLSDEVEAKTANLVEGLSNLTIGIGSITNSVSGIRNLSSQILSLLRVIPTELGNLIQNVIRSNARIESILLNIDRKIAPSPSLSLQTNIRLEDALGRIHADIPYEWFQYWETFEGLLKARFKETPGRQKIEDGDFRLVHAKRPAISFNKDSWSETIGPGAQIIMLMLIKNINIQDSSCPRRSCAGKAVSESGTVVLVTCPECGLRFIPQTIPADSADANEVARVQRIEDAKLFGKRAPSEETGELDSLRQRLDVTEDIEMMDVSGGGTKNLSESQTLRIPTHRNVLTGSLMDIQESVDSCGTSSHNPEPPIISWLSQTEPPKTPDSIREWRDMAETKQSELKEREVKDLEVFKNVQIVIPAEAEVLGANEPSIARLKENEMDLDIGPRIYYRNILNRYPQIGGPLARRLAIGNWRRQMRLRAKQGEAERAKARAASREVAAEGRRERKLGPSKRRTDDVLAEADEWEDVNGNDRCATLPTSPNHQTEPRVNGEQGAFGQPIETVPPWSLPGQLLQGPDSTSSGGIASPWAPYCPTQQHWQFQGHPAANTPNFDASTFPAFQQEPTDQSYNFFPNITKTKERRFSSLPPLPLPLTETRLTAGLTMCYLCHSQVRIQRKQSWRNHVMDDLKPYMCPIADCSDASVSFSRRAGLLQHIMQHGGFAHSDSKITRCPFCDINNLPGPMERGGRLYIKHIGHHMEEIAFGVVSTAYEDWSYDESGSDLDLACFYTSDLTKYDQDLPSSLNYDNNFSEPTFKSTFAASLEHFTNGYTEAQYAHDDTQYELNYWTEKVTATSPASSANSGLRDPYPTDYLSASSAGSDSHDFSRRQSRTAGTPTNRIKTGTRKHSKNNTQRTPNEKRVGRRKAPLRPEQRRQAHEIRKQRACLRCKFLKKTCDKGEPCNGCKSSKARLSTCPCTRIAIKDLGYFLRDWKVDFERHITLGVTVSNIKGFSDLERVIYITHGYGHWLPLTAREVFLRDDSVLGVDWVEAKESESGVRCNQPFEVETAKLSTGWRGLDYALMMDYLDKHIDGGFENFVDEHFEGTPFLTECLKTVYRYFLRDQSALLRKALRLITAYNLTMNLTMMEDGSQSDVTGRVQNSDSKLYGKVAAPVMINFEVKKCLAGIWRDIHQELLSELDALYGLVYSGQKWKNWDKIFIITLFILAVWEEIQFDCHYRVPDEYFCREFCSNMEGIPAGVLISLFCAVSQRLPRFEEWKFRIHGPNYFDQNFALQDMLTEMGAHVRKYESYLRSRSRDAQFDRNDFDSLSNKFLAQIFLRERSLYEQPDDTH